MVGVIVILVLAGVTYVLQTTSAQPLVAVITALCTLVTALTVLLKQLQIMRKVDVIHTNTNATLTELIERLKAAEQNAATPDELAARQDAGTPAPALPGPPSRPASK
jgi:hypothetical protein